jgi:hypothetical protein
MRSCAFYGREGNGDDYHNVLSCEGVRVRGDTECGNGEGRRQTAASVRSC